MRREGHKAPYPGVQYVRQVIARCDGRSVISGARENLCVVVLNEGEGRDNPENAVLVTSTESVFLNACNNKRAMIELLRPTS